jgi:hypothetical protein
VPAPVPVKEDPNRVDGIEDQRVNGTDTNTTDAPRPPAPEGDRPGTGTLEDRNEPPGTNPQDQIRDEAAGAATRTGI